MRRLAPVVASFCIAAVALGMVSAAPAPCDEQKKVTQVVSAEKSGCAVESAARHLVSALTVMDEDAAGRTQVIAALESLTKLGPQAETRIAALWTEAGLTCNTKNVVAKVDTVKSECSKSKQVAQVTDAKSACSSKQIAQVADAKSACSSKQVAQVADAKAACSKSGQVALAAGEKAACGNAAKVALAAGEKAACCDAAKIALAAGSACCAKSGKTQQARFVAFGCEKSDRLARVAAQSYMNLLMEMKKMSGAEGCPAEAATKVLAGVVEDIQAERVTQTDETPETTPVSLGAVADKPACTAKN